MTRASFMPLPAIRLCKSTPPPTITQLISHLAKGNSNRMATIKTSNMAPIKGSNMGPIRGNSMPCKIRITTRITCLRVVNRAAIFRACRITTNLKARAVQVANTTSNMACKIRVVKKAVIFRACKITINTAIRRPVRDRNLQIRVASPTKWVVNLIRKIEMPQLGPGQVLLEQPRWVGQLI